MTGFVVQGHICLVGTNNILIHSNCIVLTCITKYFINAF